MTVDHALAIAEADLVVFADAEIGAEGSFSFAPVEGEGATGMGSHELCPQAVLTLAKTLYGPTPPAFVLGIAGWDYGEVKEGLSEEAKAHLDEAEAFFLDWYAKAFEFAPSTATRRTERSPMHELSLCESLLDILKSEAETAKFQKGEADHPRSGAAFLGGAGGFALRFRCRDARQPWPTGQSSISSPSRPRRAV